jgi:adenine-specific DNA-methyltransferase
MATKKTPKPEARTEDYLHQNVTRPNNPEAGHHSADKVKVPPKVKYQYDPHLDSQLVWASKAERTEIEVDTVSLHKHEVILP